MTLVADVDANVVEERGIFEPFALAVGEAVHAACLIEQRQGEPRDLVRVFRPVVAAFGEFDDAAAADVGIAVGLRDLLPVTGDVVEDQSFAKREVAQRDLGGAETLHDRIEQNRAGDGQIGAPRLESGQPHTLLEIRVHERVPQPAQLLRRHTAASQR